MQSVLLVDVGTAFGLWQALGGGSAHGCQSHTVALPAGSLHGNCPAWSGRQAFAVTGGRCSCLALCLLGASCLVLLQRGPSPQVPDAERVPCWVSVTCWLTCRRWYLPAPCSFRGGA